MVINKKKVISTLFKKEDDNDIKETVDEIQDKIMVAQKMCFKGQLFGHVSNGGGTINLGNNYVINFVANNEKYVTIQLIQYALNKEVMTQSWRKSKKVVQSKKKSESVSFESTDNIVDEMIL